MIPFFYFFFLLSVVLVIPFFYFFFLLSVVFLLPIVRFGCCFFCLWLKETIGSCPTKESSFQMGPSASVGKTADSRSNFSHTKAGSTINPVDDGPVESTSPQDYFSAAEEQEQEAGEEEDLTNKVPVVTAPCRIERCQGAGAKDLKRSKSSMQATVFDLFKGFSPGSDLTRFQLPPQFNLPKSQLQAYGESVYCCAQDLLGMCTAGATPLDRFLAVVRWHISTTRPAPFARAPYNPILGETHHVSAGDLNVLCEQVCFFWTLSFIIF